MPSSTADLSSGLALKGHSGTLAHSTLAPSAFTIARVSPRQRVVVYVEREDGLLVFNHRDHPEAGTQVPAGGVMAGEALTDAAIREVREETGVPLLAEPELLGVHEHRDGLGRAALSHFFRVSAPDGLPSAWQHVVTGQGEDATFVFDCRFDPSPKLWPVQAVFITVE
jgi:ADP-ribose pyrophosphatase YjhB (NUDIX family)